MRNPFKNYVQLTPDDDVDIPEVEAIYVGDPGDLVVLDNDGEQVTFTITVGDIILPISPKRIMESTDNNNIVGLK